MIRIRTELPSSAFDVQRTTTKKWHKMQILYIFYTLISRRIDLIECRQCAREVQHTEINEQQQLNKKTLDISNAGITLWTAAPFSRIQNWWIKQKNISFVRTNNGISCTEHNLCAMHVVSMPQLQMQWMTKHLWARTDYLCVHNFYGGILCSCAPKPTDIYLNQTQHTHTKYKSVPSLRRILSIASINMSNKKLYCNKE